MYIAKRARLPKICGTITFSNSKSMVLKGLHECKAYVQFRASQTAITSIL